jgi:MFS family permease
VAEGTGRLAPVFGANVLFGAGLFAHAFLYNFYLQSLGHGAVVMGNAAAALTAGGLTALLPAGLIVDRAGPRRGYLLAAALAALGLALGALATGPLAVYAAAFVAGTGTATWRVSMAPLLLGMTDGRLRARAMSWNVGLLVASGAVWTALSGSGPGWLENGLGLGRPDALRVALLLGAAATLLAGPAVLLTPPFAAESMRDRDHSTHARLPLSLLVGVVLVALWMTGSALVLPFFNIFFERVHSLPVARIGVILALSQALTAVALVAGAEAAARLGPGRALMAWMLVFPPALWALAAVDALPLAILLFLVQGVVPAATNPLIDQLLLERAPRGRQGAVSGARNAATEISGLVGASAGGRVLEGASFAALFASAGVVALAGAVGLTAWLRRVQSSSPEPSEMRPRSTRQSRSA